jgi:hypothetical protein
MTPVDAALFYAERFGPIWPQTAAKTGFKGTGGSRDATRDEAVIREMWQRFPDAVPALITGAISGAIALDVDIKNGRHGIDEMEALGISTHPTTPTAHTPSGGLHLLFRAPDHLVRSSLDKLGPGLEVKGENAWITLPPGPNRFWDPHLGPDTPLAPMPAWMIVREPERKPAPKPRHDIRLSRYGEVALRLAVQAILSAPAGQQRNTLNRECFAIGGLVSGGVIPAALALESLQWASRQMPSFDRRRSWRVAELDRQVRASFLDGQLKPRAVPA